MTELVPFEFSEERSYDEQMRVALTQALSIHGTVINDLQRAINCILQMERGMAMTETPNPVEAECTRLKVEYNMHLKDTQRQSVETTKLLEASSVVEGNSDQLELDDVWCDDCHMKISVCMCR